jgi:hypothetical protein
MIIPAARVASKQLKCGLKMQVPKTFILRRRNNKNTLFLASLASGGQVLILHEALNMKMWEK